MADRALAKKLLTMNLATLQWVEYSKRLTRPAALPRSKGVYIVAVDARVIYIGSAGSAWDRVYCHERLKSHPEIQRSLIAYIPTRGKHQRSKLEIGLIVLYRPVLNRKHNHASNGQFRYWSLLFTRAGTELAQEML